MSDKFSDVCGDTRHAIAPSFWADDPAGKWDSGEVIVPLAAGSEEEAGGEERTRASQQTPGRR